MQSGEKVLYLIMACLTFSGVGKHETPSGQMAFKKKKKGARAVSPVPPQRWKTTSGAMIGASKGLIKPYALGYVGRKKKNAFLRWEKKIRGRS